VPKSGDGESLAVEAKGIGSAKGKRGRSLRNSLKGTAIYWRGFSIRKVSKGTSREVGAISA